MTYRRTTADFWTKCYDAGPDKENLRQARKAVTLCDEINERAFELFQANRRNPKRLYLSQSVNKTLEEELKNPDNKILTYSLEIKVLKRQDSILIIE